MKLISLNTLMGVKIDLLVDFIERHSFETDIFCFQEVHTQELFDKIQTSLPAFQGFYMPWLAIFVKNLDAKTIPSPQDFLRTSGSKDKIQGQIVQLLDVGGFRIGNVHSHWFDGEKLDNDITLETSKKLVSIIKDNMILIGDFNLFPETESVAMIERAGMRNLIREYGVNSTRPHDWPFPKPFADYAFVGPKIKVTDFKILPDEVSDHLPMMLEFDYIMQ